MCVKIKKKYIKIKTRNINVFKNDIMAKSENIISTEFDEHETNGSTTKMLNRQRLKIIMQIK
nr:MAG TPA: hypothetical protein [Caudoviricetes sp.]